MLETKHTSAPQALPTLKNQQQYLRKRLHKQQPSTVLTDCVLYLNYSVRTPLLACRFFSPSFSARNLILSSSYYLCKRFIIRYTSPLPSSAVFFANLHTTWQEGVGGWGVKVGQKMRLSACSGEREGSRLPSNDVGPGTQCWDYPLKKGKNVDDY